MNPVNLSIAGVINQAVSQYACGYAPFKSGSDRRGDRTG